MTSSATPLHGTELIDCAKANANTEVEIVSELCGYGKDIATFEQELKKACDSIGLKIKSIEDLRENQPDRNKHQKIEIFPETPNQF